MGREKRGLNFAGRSSQSECIFLNKSAPSRTDVVSLCKDVDRTAKVSQGNPLVGHMALGVDTPPPHLHEKKKLSLNTPLTQLVPTEEELLCQTYQEGPLFVCCWVWVLFLEGIPSDGTEGKFL